MRIIPQGHKLLEGVVLCSSRRALKQPSFATDSKGNVNYWEQTATSEKKKHKMHQEEFSSMSSYLNDIQLMALKVIPFHPRLLSTK